MASGSGGTSTGEDGGGGWRSMIAAASKVADEGLAKAKGAMGTEDVQEGGMASMRASLDSLKKGGSRLQEALGGGGGGGGGGQAAPGDSTANAVGAAGGGGGGVESVGQKLGGGLLALRQAARDAAGKMGLEPVQVAPDSGGSAGGKGPPPTPPRDSSTNGTAAEPGEREGLLGRGETSGRAVAGAAAARLASAGKAVSGLAAAATGKDGGEVGGVVAAARMAAQSKKRLKTCGVSFALGTGFCVMASLGIPGLCVEKTPRFPTVWHSISA